MQAVRPANQHQVGGHQLVVEQVFDGAEVIEAGIGQALGLNRGGITHHVALGQGFAIDHRHHAGNAGAGADLGPAKGLHQGLGQGQATGFNNDAVELVGALEQQLHRRQEFILHRAAEAAVGQFHHPAVQLLLGAEATTTDQFGIDAHLPEFIHQNGQPQATGKQQLAQQGRFAGPQKARHHRHRQAALGGMGRA